jgi:DNA-binding CsgD family transcriptional regulator
MAIEMKAASNALTLLDAVTAIHGNRSMVPFSCLPGEQAGGVREDKTPARIASGNGRLYENKLEYVEKLEGVEAAMDAKERLLQILKETLSDTEFGAVMLQFLSENPLKQKEIARILGCSLSRVREAWAKAIRKLRGCSNKQELFEHFTTISGQLKYVGLTWDGLKGQEDSFPKVPEQEHNPKVE